MEAALQNLETLVKASPEDQRQPVTLALLKLIASIESPDDMIQRVGALHLQTAGIVTGINNGLFTAMVEAAEPVTVDVLAQTTGAEPDLLKRLLRYLAAIAVVDQTAKETYVANNYTRNLAQDVSAAGVRHYFYTCGPQFQALPGYFKKNGYKSPYHEAKTIFQEAWNTEDHGFAWFSSHPDNLSYFNDYMALRRQPELSWLSVYPVADETKDLTDPERAVYVNVGGGIGHQCAEFKKHHPNVPGQVILEDLPHSIANALPTEGVRNIEHNFFEPQPVKGAKFYFVRGVLHNHPDHRVKILLGHIKDAMVQDSVLLVDEIIVPEIAAAHDAVTHDITMMSAFSGMERTEEQFRNLFADSGLKLIQTRVYNPGPYEGVMEVRLA